MPTYEYECDSCGDRSTVKQRITDAPLKVCRKVIYADQYTDHCLGNLKRLLFPVSAKLVGGGWAKDGYSGGGR